MFVRKFRELVRGHQRTASRRSHKVRSKLSLEILEDRTLPAPIGSIEVESLGAIDVSTYGGAAWGPGFDSTQSIDPSLGQVSISGNSSQTHTILLNYAGQSITGNYTITGSATVIPPTQPGKPIEGDVTYSQNVNFAEATNANGDNYVYPTDLNGLWKLTFNTPGILTVSYVASLSIQAADSTSGAEIVGPRVGPFAGIVPTTGSGEIFSGTILAGGGFGVSCTEIYTVHGNGSISDQESYHWTFTPSGGSVSTEFQNTNVLHKLLYAGQQLATNVSVTNKGGTEANGSEAFYLSKNTSSSVDGDRSLTVNGNVSLDLQGGQSMSLPQIPSVLNVVIPNDIQPGTYYLKAKFVGGDDPTDNTVAVSPALSVCVNSQRQASSFTDPGNATVFDNAVSAVKQGTAQYPNMSSISDIAAFVQSQEGLRYFPYSDNGVPAIGFGSDLIDKTTGQVNTQFEAIINTYLANNPQLGFTFQDFLDEKLVYIDKKTAIALFSSYFQTVVQYVETNYSGLTFNEAAALIDIGYNIGTAGLKKFTSMNADIAMGTPFGFACAGLELVNSIRTSQLSALGAVSRVQKDFYLLTSAPGVADLL